MNKELVWGVTGLSLGQAWERSCALINSSFQVDVVRLPLAYNCGLSITIKMLIEEKPAECTFSPIKKLSSFRSMFREFILRIQERLASLSIKEIYLVYEA
ncbi:hypothetical protein N005_18930 [Pseudomonas mediterranea CFBP 5447]|nr:hypothetical protein N005_18930 [Pseudomonas mediterranea CFBP 5447]